MIGVMIVIGDWGQIVIGVRPVIGVMIGVRPEC